MYDVIIPWRTDNGPRERVANWVRERWRMRCPDANVLFCDSGDPVFSRSASRNAGVRSSSQRVVVFADADTPPIPAYLEAAVREAEEGNWCLPFGEGQYYNLGSELTDMYLNYSPSTDIFRPYIYEHKLTAWAGIVVAPREAVDKVGGYDERFKGWGHEDVAFRLALDNEWGKHKRVDDGYVCHFWHPRESAKFDTLEELENRRLFDAEYKRKYRWKDERV